MRKTKRIILKLVGLILSLLWLVGVIRITENPKEFQAFLVLCGVIAMLYFWDIYIKMINSWYPKVQIVEGIRIRPKTVKGYKCPKCKATEGYVIDCFKNSNIIVTCSCGYKDSPENFNLKSEKIINETYGVE